MGPPEPRLGAESIKIQLLSLTRLNTPLPKLSCGGGVFQVSLDFPEG